MLLFVTAALLFVLLTPLAVAAKVVVAIYRRTFDWSWFMRLALALDQMGNVVGDDLFNWLLIKNDYMAPFGDEDETVSSVLGKNFLINNLTISGSLLRKMLHGLDSNHSVRAIEE